MMRQKNQLPEFWDEMFSLGKDYQVFNKVLLNKLISDYHLEGDILDVGCGTGDLTIALAERGLSVTGLDFSSVAIEKAKERAKKSGVTATFHCGDLSTIKEGRKYKVIFCKLVYAFIPSKQEFLQKVKSILTDSGVFIVITPILNESNRDIEKKPGICASDEDVALLKKEFRLVDNYHTNYEDEGRIVETLVCHL